MNLELLDPNLHGIPSRLEFSLGAGGDVPYYHMIEPGRPSAANTSSFTSDTSSCLGFNRRGTYLAIGWTHGQVGIFDVFTRSIACLLPSHAHVVSAVSWSRDSTLLLTGSYDRRIRLWYLAGPGPLQSPERQVTCMVFDKEVFHAQLHPHFCMERSSTSSSSSSSPSSRLAIVLLVDGTLLLASLQRDSGAVATSPSPTTSTVLSTLVSTGVEMCLSATFDHHGKRVIFGVQQEQGGNQGSLVAVAVHEEEGGREPEGGEGRTRDVLTSTGMRGLALSRDGAWLAGLVSSDRVIRVLSTVERKGHVIPRKSGGGGGSRSSSSPSGAGWRDFYDVIDRVQWRAVCFSGNHAEWVVAGSRKTYMYEVFIWSREEGALLHRIEGPQVELLGLAWHPLRSFLVTASDPLTDVTSEEDGNSMGGATTTSSNANGTAAAASARQSKPACMGGRVNPECMGAVQFWCTDPNANWTAFAPDFQELDENVEYIEKEDEFDRVVEAAPDKTHHQPAGAVEQGEDEDVDIDTVFKVAAFMSDDSDDERDQFYIYTEPARGAGATGRVPIVSRKRALDGSLTAGDE